MTKEKTSFIVLAAGQGTRMVSSRPKVMHGIAGQPMIAHLIRTLESLAPDRIVVVVGAKQEEIAAAVDPHPTVIQDKPLGTAHAVLAARDYLRKAGGDVFVVYGDTPLISARTLKAMSDARRAGADLVVLGFRPEKPGDYGRLIAADDDRLDAIVEAKEASADQLALDLCNSGVICVDGARLLALLERVDNDNAKGEYYLTDIVAMAREEKLDCRFVIGEETELLGINTRADLAKAEAIAQKRLRDKAMDNGATLTEPESVWLSWDTRIGRDVVIGQNVVFGPGVVVGNGVEILPFCHIEGAVIGDNARIGPFARLRPGTEIHETARIGNFVEVKNARIGDGAKVNHLSYIGDAQIGAQANIGAGTITCNYDGVGKHQTDIGERAFIGSNTALVAPLRIGAGAVVGAGSTLTKDVSPSSLGIGRAKQQEIKDWANRPSSRSKDS